LSGESQAALVKKLKAGARGYLLKSDARRCLVGAIESLAAHKPFFTARVSEALLESFLAKAERTRLSNRIALGNSSEREGHSNWQTAAILDISIRTVITAPQSCASSISTRPLTSRAMRSAAATRRREAHATDEGVAKTSAPVRIG
jgi:DNA-binding NarL/FixJ family response regulator